MNRIKIDLLSGLTLFALTSTTSSWALGPIPNGTYTGIVQCKLNTSSDEGPVWISYRASDEALTTVDAYGRAVKGSTLRFSFTNDGKVRVTSEDSKTTGTGTVDENTGILAFNLETSNAPGTTSIKLRPTNSTTVEYVTATTGASGTYLEKCSGPMILQ